MLVDQAQAIELARAQASDALCEILIDTIRFRHNDRGVRHPSSLSRMPHTRNAKPRVPVNLGMRPRHGNSVT